MKKILLIILLLFIIKIADSMRFNMNTVYKISEVTITVDTWELLIQQIIKVESNGNHPDWQIGDDGKAIGPMQIHKIMVDEVNRIQDSIQFTYLDRWSLQKSIQMFNIYQEYWNPEHDTKLAKQLWNGGSKLLNPELAYLTEDYLNKFEL